MPSFPRWFLEMGLVVCLFQAWSGSTEFPCAHGTGDALFVPDMAADKAADLSGKVKAVEPVNTADYHEVVDAGSGVILTCYFKDADGSGFRDALSGPTRRERLYDAVRYIASVLASGESRTLTIVVNPSENSGVSGIPVAYCGPVLIPSGGILVPLARYSLVHGVAPAGYESYPDMLLTVNWAAPWHEETSPPPADRLDLVSVMIHELTHGLGFNGVLSDTTPAGSGIFTPFDRLIGKVDGTPLINNASSYEGVPGDLISGALVFLGSEAAATYGGFPPLYAPDPFLQGTSLQHWDPGRLSVPDVVMAPSYLVGSSLRQYAGFEVAALRDLGYAAENSTGLSACPLTGITILEPRENPAIVSGDDVAITVTAQPAYAEGNCSLVTTATRVAYYLDDTHIGDSTQDALRFPLLVRVTAGSHTLRAVATEQLAGSLAETTITFTAYYNPGEDALAWTPDGSAMDFGGVVRGKTARHAFQVVNRGNVPAGVHVTIEGDDAFTLESDPPSRVEAGETVPLNVTFRPATVGKTYQTTLRVAADHGQVLEISLAGRGRAFSLFRCGEAGLVAGSASGTGDAVILVLALFVLWQGKRRGTGKVAIRPHPWVEQGKDQVRAGVPFLYSGED